MFDVEGKFMRAFGNQFQGGGHGLEVRSEGGEQFLYVTGYQHLKNFAKLTLQGEQVWEKRAPMESKRWPCWIAYGETAHPKRCSAPKRFAAAPPHPREARRDDPRQTLAQGLFRGAWLR